MTEPSAIRRIGILRGVVQGVGFRPFVLREARALDLVGTVANAGSTAVVDVEGAEPLVAQFQRRLAEAPLPVRVDGTEWRDAVPVGRSTFEIEPSGEGDRGLLPVPPDSVLCEACRADLARSGDRRQGYAFTSCATCGPRFTIVQSLPYDRARTTMAPFELCQACAREYRDPSDRRHHAQSSCCPQCGPQLRLCDRDGRVIDRGDAALGGAIGAIRRGEILALKGVGGYQLICDATRPGVVERLRSRKHRPDQPFAVMVRDVVAVRELAFVGEVERGALESPAGPIVLLRRRADSKLADAVAPRLGRLGVMLPTSPLHWVLMRELGPVVCTSGNVHGEPIAIHDDHALSRLRPIADAFLMHERTIAHRADDTVVHVVGGRVRALRLGRGSAPRTLPLCSDSDARVRLCLGGHLKVAPALATEGAVTLWPHIGDLDVQGARDAFDDTLASMCALHSREPDELVCDLHPDYATTIWAERQGLPVHRVEHHAAHVAACLAEHPVDGGVGFAWDGFGLAEGPGGFELRGGETYAIGRTLTHVGGMLPFPLPGGDAAARDGTRALAGLLFAAHLAEHARSAERHLPVAASSLASPTTSVGRLFDAIAALAGVREASTYEGQAAMELETLAEPGAVPYPFALVDERIDWRPMLEPMLAERDDAPRVASRFHATLAAMVVEVAARRRAEHVVLAGGCFQNAVLTELVLEALAERSIHGYLPERVPTNDGGLALGQAWLAGRARVSP